MTALNKIIAIWGAAILLYLIVANSKGASAGFTGVTNLITGTTTALQGRSKV